MLLLYYSFSFKKDNVCTFYTKCVEDKVSLSTVWGLGPRVLFSFVQLWDHRSVPGLRVVGEGTGTVGPGVGVGGGGNPKAQRRSAEVKTGQHYGVGISLLKQISQPLLAHQRPFLFSSPAMGREEGHRGKSGRSQGSVHPKETERASRGTNLRVRPSVKWVCSPVTQAPSLSRQDVHPLCAKQSVAPEFLLSAAHGKCLEISTLLRPLHPGELTPQTPPLCTTA